MEDGLSWVALATALAALVVAVVSFVVSRRRGRPRSR